MAWLEDMPLLSRDDLLAIGPESFRELYQKENLQLDLTEVERLFGD